MTKKKGLKKKQKKTIDTLHLNYQFFYKQYHYFLGFFIDKIGGL